jgi:carboxyl-terminal processing protease
MPPEMFAHINESMTGEYEGIGATVRQDETTGGLELVTIMDASPAEAAGLFPGDQIVEVEGANITHLTQSEIISLVRGPAGTTVRLGIARPEVADVLQFDVLRQKIFVPSVISRLLPGNIGYVRLSQFESDTARDMRGALEALHANDLKGLVLDLRGNPGGYLTTSIDVASAYLSDGAVLIERSPSREQVHEVLGDAIAPDVPMVVLVDQGSASASELIAGALQDHHRATVVGMTTFGKGSVQTWRQLSNGGGIRITISRWYTPDGHSVSEVGIKPDVIVPFEPEAAAGEESDNQLRAALDVLNGALTPGALSMRKSDEGTAIN